MLAGTYTAAVVGLSVSIVGGTIWGTAALSFIVGSSVGFALGSLHWYSRATDQALVHLRRYPALMRLHLIANFPWKPELEARPVDWYTVDRFSSDWVYRSILVAGWMTAQPALDDIRAREEAAIVDAYAQEPAGQPLIEDKDSQ